MIFVRTRVYNTARITIGCVALVSAIFSFSLSLAAQVASGLDSTESTTAFPSDATTDQIFADSTYQRWRMNNHNRAALSGYTTGTWKTDITEMTDFERAQRSASPVLQPLNVVNGDYANYPDYQAQDAVAHANGYGFVDGFGSQGLSLKDYLVFGTSQCASDWCAMFSTYNRANALELQQIANSDPTDTTCGGGPTYPNCTPTGDAGDLTTWLPFAAQHGMNVLELYTVDAELAYDPCFCVLSGTNCGTGSNAGCTHGSFTALNGWTATQQHDFFQSVGLGYTGCSPASGQTQTTAGGTCSYRDTINQQHEYQ